jgi:hypothetical protein
MRKLKMLGVSAVALLALAVAAIGATSASATVLCSTNPSTHVCPSANLLAGPGRSAAISASSTNATLVTSGGLLNPSVTCRSSTANITAGPGGGSGVALPGRLTGLTFTSCTSTNPSGCSSSAIVTGLPTSGSLAWLSGTHNGTITITAPDVEIDCPFLGATIRCHYGGNSVTGTVTGGNPATVSFNAVVNSLTGSPCPPRATWTATYTVTSPRPMYVEDQ